jgi:hypothetical protein
MADRISSGWDRNNFDFAYNQAIAWQDYRKTRLLPIFESLLKDEEERKHYTYRYPLQELNPQASFPCRIKKRFPK